MTKRAKLSLSPDDNLSKDQALGSDPLASGDPVEAKNSPPEDDFPGKSSGSLGLGEPVTVPTTGWLNGRQIAGALLLVAVAAVSILILKRK